MIVFLRNEDKERSTAIRIGLRDSRAMVTSLCRIDFKQTGFAFERNKFNLNLRLAFCPFHLLFRV